MKWSSKETLDVEITLAPDCVANVKPESLYLLLESYGSFGGAKYKFEARPWNSGALARWLKKEILIESDVLYELSVGQEKGSEREIFAELKIR